MNNEELEKEIRDCFARYCNYGCDDSSAVNDCVQLILQREQTAYSRGYGDGCADTIDEYEE